MFGYVKPFRGLLRVCEHETYKAAYCGLCHTLGRRYGWPARFLLQYDFVFLALAVTEGPFSQSRRRCVASPFCAKNCYENTEAFELAADIHILLTYWKLKDTAQDKTWAVAARLGAWLMNRAYRKAAMYRPELEAQVRTRLNELSAYEARWEASLDKPADAFASLLAAVADTVQDESRRRILYQLFYHIGRWVYLIDACDDLPEDTKAYNPVAARFGITDGQWTGESKENMRATLGLSRQRAEAALALLAPDNQILENIVIYGLPWVEQQVLKGTYGKRAKKQYE